MSAVNRGGAGALCLVLGVAVWLIVRDAQVAVPREYEYDEGVYAATADAVAHGGHLYRDIFLSQPPLFVLMTRAMFGLWGTSLAVARSTVVVLSVVWLIAILAILWARGSPWGGLFVLCLLLGRASFLKAAQTVQMQVPGEALACAAVGLAIWGLRRPGHVWWAGAGLLATLAAMTKLTAVTAVIPIVGAAITEPRAASRWRMLALGALLAFGALLPVVCTRGFIDQVFSFHFVLARRVDESVATHLAAIGDFLIREWPLSLVFLLGCWRSMATGAAFERALVAWFAADVALLAAVTPLWPHNLMILVSPMGLLAGLALRQRGEGCSDPGPSADADRPCVAYGWLPTVVPRWHWARLMIPVLLAVCAVAYVGQAVSGMRRPTPSPQLEHAVRRITDAVPPQGKVLTDDPMVAFLAGRRVVDGLIDSSLTRIWAGQISDEVLTSALHGKGTDAVVLWRGTFRQYFPTFESAATRAFPVTEPVPGGRVLLLKQGTRRRP